MSQPFHLLHPTLLRLIKPWFFLETTSLKDAVGLSFDCPDCQHTDKPHRIVGWRCCILEDGYRFHGYELKDISLVPYMIRSPFCGWKGTISFGILVNLP